VPADSRGRRCPPPARQIAPPTQDARMKRPKSPHRGKVQLGARQTVALISQLSPCWPTKVSITTRCPGWPRGRTCHSDRNESRQLRAWTAGSRNPRQSPPPCRSSGRSWTRSTTSTSLSTSNGASR
jgi:hypothetical protein